VATGLIACAITASTPCCSSQIASAAMVAELITMQPAALTAEAAGRGAGRNGN
jgi:hypothetical protein